MSRAARDVCLILLAVSLAPHAGAAGEVSPMALDGAGRFQVGWNVVETSHEFRGRLDEGGHREIRLAVEQWNVTDVAFVLRWAESDDPTGLSQPDLFELDVVTPQAAAVPGAPATSRAGVLRVAATGIATVPSALEIEASSLADLRAKLAPLASSAGRGTWPIVVTLQDAGNPAGAQVDRGNAYTLTVTTRHYEPVMTRVVSLDPPPLTLVEAAKGAPAVWMWTTGLLGAAAVGLGGFLVRSRRKP